MKREDESFSFGPIPSRRLGRSIGVKNLPLAHCSYACIYCQAGATQHMTVKRKDFYPPELIYDDVCRRLESLDNGPESVDYITIVPDGEPTLDSNLGTLLELLGRTGIARAVISNASTIQREDIRDDLALADWVSLKVDAVTPSTWRSLNRPHGKLQLTAILEGIELFSQTYQGSGGSLMTESMLVHGVNGDLDDLARLGEYLALVEPKVAYLSIPTRPPVENWVQSPSTSLLNSAYQELASRLEPLGSKVAYLLSYEGDDFSHGQDVERDILSITSVHPMRVAALLRLLHKAGETWTLVEDLVAQGQLVQAKHQGHTYYMRKLPGAVSQRR